MINAITLATPGAQVVPTVASRCDDDAVRVECRSEAELRDLVAALERRLADVREAVLTSRKSEP